MKGIVFDGTADSVILYPDQLSEREVEVLCAEGWHLNGDEKKTLSDLRYSALTGPEMFSNAVELIERLLIEKLRSSYE